MFRSFAAAAAGLVSLSALPAVAQEPPVTEVEEVVVTAARTETPRSAIPATVQLIGADEVAVQTALGASAVDVVATLVPSFSPTRQKLSGSGETLRGRSPLYLVDGVPQSTPLRDDSRDGYTIDPFFIDRVEVIFGSNAIQGIGATGGVVNYVTAAPGRNADGWTGRLLAQTSFDESVLGDSLGWKLAGITGRDFGAWDFTFGAARESRGAFYDGEDRRIGMDGAQGEIQDSLSWSVFAKVGYEPSAGRRLEAWVNHFELAGDGDYVTVPGNRAAGLPTTSVRGVAPGVQPANDVTSAALTWTDRNLLGGIFRAQLFAHDYNGVFGGGTFATFQDPAIAPVGTLFDQSANNSEKLGFKLDWETRFDFAPDLRVLVGLDGLRDSTHQALILTGRNWVPQTRYESLAPFIQLNQRLLDGRLHLSGGLRHESATLVVDDFTTLAAYGAQQVDGGRPSFEETLGNFGATFELVPGLTAYASFAQGFSMADVGRVLRGIDTPGQDVDTFLDVSPVVSDNSEIGLEFARGPFRGSAAAFRSASDRGALLVMIGGVYEVQRQRTEIEGLELTGRWDLSPDLRLGGAWSHLRGRTDANGDGTLDRDLDGANIAPDRLLLWGETDRGELSLRLQAQHLFARDFDGQDPRNAFEGYSLVDAIGVWRAGFGEVSLGVQNLLDAQYVTYFSDTQAPTDNGRFFAGRGRTLTLALTRRF